MFRINSKLLIFIFILISSLLISVNITLCFEYDRSEIIRAMKDELSRSMRDLKLNGLQNPYYIEYSLVFKKNNLIECTLGTTIDTKYTESAQLTIGMRVGDYKFDNTNFFDFGLSLFGSGDDEESFKNRSVPIELDYKTFRRELWLATDAAYKRAAEIYSKKEAALKNRNSKDTTWDYIPLPPEEFNNVSNSNNINQFDANKYELICKNLSGLFSNYTSISSSNIGLEYNPEIVYFLNSEGRSYSKIRSHFGLEIVASTQGEEGMPLAEVYTFYAKTPDGLPTYDSLKSTTLELAEKLKTIRSAKIPEEPYIGPVLFEGQAAAEIFAQVFAPCLVTQRSQMTDNGIQEGDRYTAFQNKIGGRVLPEFLSLISNPLMKEYGGMSLTGSYDFDDEGIPAQEVELVTSGYLKNLLSGRIPTRRVKKSNGSCRGGAPMFGVLQLLTSDEDHQFSNTDLKNKLLELVEKRELPYGIIIRKLLNQNIMYTTLSRLTSGEYPMPQNQSSLPLLEVIKIYPDGTEEPVRGCEGRGFGIQSFKDIIAVGGTSQVLNFLAPAVTSPFITGGSSFLSSTVIVPDLLFEDGEIKTMLENYPKPPYLANPMTH